MAEDNTKRIIDIAKRIDAINAEKLEVSRRGNELWEEKNKLANEYRKLTGNEIV